MSKMSINDDKEALKAFNNCPVTLGTDLEVSIHNWEDPFEVVSALKWWDGDVKSGSIGADGRTSFFQYLVELRPKPAYHGEDLSNNIVKVVTDAIKEHPDLTKYHWKPGTGDFVKVPQNIHNSGASFLPKGGHIHFGSLKFDPDIVYAFDMLLAPLNLLMENPLKAMFRRCFPYAFRGDTYYGQLGGYRVSQKYPTWEYRTMSNFCNNPFEAEAFFNTAKAVANEMLVNKTEFMKLLKNKMKTLSVDIVSFNVCLKEVFIPRVKVIFDVLKTLKLLQNEYGQNMLHRFKTYVTNCDPYKFVNMLETFGIVASKSKPSNFEEYRGSLYLSKALREQFESAPNDAMNAVVSSMCEEFLVRVLTDSPVDPAKEGRQTNYFWYKRAETVAAKVKTVPSVVHQYVDYHKSNMSNTIRRFSDVLNMPYGLTKLEWDMRKTLAQRQISVSATLYDLGKLI